MCHIIACEVFRPELEMLTAKMTNPPTLYFMDQRLHDVPATLTEKIQEQIDILEDQGVMEIRLCYGVCGRAISALRTKRASLIIPRVHDGIPLLLGTCATSDTGQADTAEGSIFWMSAGWLRYSQLPFLREKKLRKKDYVERFGEECACYLMETEDQRLYHYTEARLILWDGMECPDTIRKSGRYVAKKAKLQYTEYQGSSQYLQALVDPFLHVDTDDRFARVLTGQMLDINGDGSITTLQVPQCT